MSAIGSSKRKDTVSVTSTMPEAFDWKASGRRSGLSPSFDLRRARGFRQTKWSVSVCGRSVFVEALLR